MANQFWLWYPGDFELYHAMKQNFSRVERGYGWPAFWRSEGWRNRVAFRRTYNIERETAFTVYSKAVGFVMIGEKKYPFGQEIVCPAGEMCISIHAGCIEAFPSVYIEGDVIRSDDGWMVEDYSAPCVPAGHCKYYIRSTQDPCRWDYSEKLKLPVRTEQTCGGVLYEFETELTAVLWVKCGIERMKNITVYCGESREEALDREHCYYSWKPDPVTGKCPRCAVRFAFIPGEPVELAAIHQYVDIPVRAQFSCDDPLLERIWAVAEHTFRLCSGAFFIDGIKRDKWIWCGDAYQSFFMNRFLMADPDIEQRTLLALRGNDPMTRHINTIVDYSLFWVLSVREHYITYGDRAFLEQIWPKVQSLMAFCEKDVDERGFLCPNIDCWIFVDWAELDKESPVGAIQMLLAAAWSAMAELANALGEDGSIYREKWSQLRESIDQSFWDEELGAYVDAFTSGKRHVTRQTNIFAIMFGVADKEKRESILRHVIENDNVAPITTPYFNFFQLDVLAQSGDLDGVMDAIRSYWGGMLDRGAVTFWEEFDPRVTGPEQYDMYGDKFGKSLCHAWAASPIYLLGRYFVGLRQTGPDGSFVLEPHLEYFGRLECTLPVGGGDGFVSLRRDGNELEAWTNCENGVLVLNGNQYHLGETPIKVNTDHRLYRQKERCAKTIQRSF